MTSSTTFFILKYGSYAHAENLWLQHEIDFTKDEEIVFLRHCFNVSGLDMELINNNGYRHIGVINGIDL